MKEHDDNCLVFASCWPRHFSDVTQFFGVKKAKIKRRVIKEIIFEKDEDLNDLSAKNDGDHLLLFYHFREKWALKFNYGQSIRSYSSVTTNEKN